MIDNASPKINRFFLQHQFFPFHNILSELLQIKCLPLDEDSKLDLNFYFLAELNASKNKNPSIPDCFVYFHLKLNQTTETFELEINSS